MINAGNLKALSLLQPWASLVVMGIKTIETRRWSTDYRGEMLIHASRGTAGNIFASQLPFSKYFTDFSQLPFGEVIGSVLLTDIVRIASLQMNEGVMNRLTVEEKVFGDYTPGRYAWLFENPLKFEKTFSRRGSLYLWETEI
jgi:activating signal cointegrator 1